MLHRTMYLFVCWLRLSVYWCGCSALMPTHTFTMQIVNTHTYTHTLPIMYGAFHSCLSHQRSAVYAVSAVSFLSNLPCFNNIRSTVYVVCVMVCVSDAILQVCMCLCALYISNAGVQSIVSLLCHFHSWNRNNITNISTVHRCDFQLNTSTISIYELHVVCIFRSAICLTLTNLRLLFIVADGLLLLLLENGLCVCVWLWAECVCVCFLCRSFALCV